MKILSLFMRSRSSDTSSGEHHPWGSEKWTNGKTIILVLLRTPRGKRSSTGTDDGGGMNTFIVTRKASILFVDADSEVLKAVEAEPAR
jgi:hypothetical protein